MYSWHQDLEEHREFFDRIVEVLWLVHFNRTTSKEEAAKNSQQLRGLIEQAEQGNPAELYELAKSTAESDELWQALPEVFSRGGREIPSTKRELRNKMRRNLREVMIA